MNPPYRWPNTQIMNYLQKTILICSISLVLICSISLVMTVPAGACCYPTIHNNLPSPSVIQFSDGSTATPFDHCGDTDLCATVQYPSGDTLSIYSEGAAKCQQYMVHFVRVHSQSTLYEFSRPLNHDTPCGNEIPTRFTM